MEDIKMTFIRADESNVASGILDGQDGFIMFSRNVNDDVENSVMRRVVAAWNYCAGIPTEDIEKMPLPALFFRQAYDGLQKDNSALQHENQCLRAAVAEMQRMLPVLEYFENGEPLENDGDMTWADAVLGTGIATANAYRQTLETALAQIEKNK